MSENGRSSKGVTISSETLVVGLVAALLGGGGGAFGVSQLGQSEGPAVGSVVTREEFAAMRADINAIRATTMDIDRRLAYIEGHGGGKP